LKNKSKLKSQKSITSFASLKPGEKKKQVMTAFEQLMQQARIMLAKQIKEYIVYKGLKAYYSY